MQQATLFCLHSVLSFSSKSWKSLNMNLYTMYKTYSVHYKHLFVKENINNENFQDMEHQVLEWWWASCRSQDMLVATI